MCDATDLLLPPLRSDIWGGGGGGGGVGWACGGSRSSFRMKRRSREGRLGPSRAPVRPRLRHRDLQLDACRRCAVESPRSPPAAVQVERVALRSRRAAAQCERCTGMPHPAWRGPFQPLHLSEPGGAEHHQLPRRAEEHPWLACLLFSRAGVTEEQLNQNGIFSYM